MVNCMLRMCFLQQGLKKIGGGGQRDHCRSWLFSRALIIMKFSAMESTCVIL